MSIKNTAAPAQYPRSSQIALATANSTYTGAITTPGLLWVAGPDGSEIWDISVTPTATVTTANQMQFYMSPDGGTTNNLLPLGAVMAIYTMAQTTALPITHMPHPNGLPMGASNPLIVGGHSTYNGLAQIQSMQTPIALQYDGGISQGTANAQTLPFAYNAAFTLMGASPTTGSIIDFECGITNTGTTTIAPGGQSATAIKKGAALANLVAGDLTAGFRYRAVWDGTEWVLLITNRIYFAMGQAQAVVASAWGKDY